MDRYRGGCPFAVKRKRDSLLARGLPAAIVVVTSQGIRFSRQNVPLKCPGATASWPSESLNNVT